MLPTDTDNKEHLTSVNQVGEEANLKGLLYRRPNRVSELMTAIMELSTATNNTLETFRQLGVNFPVLTSTLLLTCIVQNPLVRVIILLGVF